jgi:CheY-like chemotaxis protein
VNTPLGRVLVVDDEPEVAQVLRDFLTGGGYVAKIAVRGSEALDILPIFRPDVVLLDLAMPKMSGMEVLERIRREQPDVPVVIVTANEDETLARSTLSAGAFDYVKKPFDFTVLERIVGAALGHRRVRGND